MALRTKMYVRLHLNDPAFSTDSIVDSLNIDLNRK